MAALRRNRVGATERPDARQAKAALAESIEGFVEAHGYLERADRNAREARDLRDRNHFADRINKAYRGGRG